VTAFVIECMLKIASMVSARFPELCGTPNAPKIVLSNNLAKGMYFWILSDESLPSL